MIKTNFHTHTKYSDGRDTPTEMIEEAIAKGFKALGFSDHTYTHKRESYAMSVDGEEKYRREIRALAHQYKDKIRVYCGIEQDSLSALPDYEDYDYIISSVHEILYHGDFYPVDHSPEIQKKLVNTVFGGDFTEMSRVYFDRLVEHVTEQKTDIVGHFDLVTKYSLIPEQSPKYMDFALEAIKEIIGHCKAFELNTGAIARGLRTVPYPADFMIDEIKRLGGAFIVSSDCHYKHKIDFWFDEAERLLLSHGFKKNEHADLNNNVRDIEIWY